MNQLMSTGTAGGLLVELPVRLDGQVRDLLVEHGGNPGESVIVTIAEWRNLAATEGARAAVTALHARENFNPQEFFARTGIRAEPGNFRPLVE